MPDRPAKILETALYAADLDAAEAFYGGVPARVRADVLDLLDESLRRLVLTFVDRFPPRRPKPIRTVK